MVSWCRSPGTMITFRFEKLSPEAKNTIHSNFDVPTCVRKQDNSLIKGPILIKLDTKVCKVPIFLQVQKPDESQHPKFLGFYSKNVFFEILTCNFVKYHFIFYHKLKNTNRLVI